MLRLPARLALLALVSGAAVLGGCRQDGGGGGDGALLDDAAMAPDRAVVDGRGAGLEASASPEVLSGAGDIAWCEPPGVGSGEVTAKILDRLPGTFFSAGDNSNGGGTLAEYENCFGRSWGRHLSRLRPAPGNHDYVSLPAADYHQYFGASAGPPGKGYYSYDRGAWHIVVLNSECTLVACGAGSEQERWLKADLASHPTRCTLAIAHRPHFSGASPSGSSYTAALFGALYDAGVDVIISGHLHWYERFKPLAPGGVVDPARGVRQFIVGTGGALAMINSGTWLPSSEVHLESVFGVIELTLRPDGYDWAFVPEAGKESQTDSGSDRCH